MHTPLPPANAKQPPKPAVGPRPAGTFACPPLGFLGKVVDLRRRNQILCRVRKWLRVPVIGPGPAPHPGHHFLPSSSGAAENSPATLEPRHSLSHPSPFTFHLSPWLLEPRPLHPCPASVNPLSSPLPQASPHLPAMGTLDTAGPMRGDKLTAGSIPLISAHLVLTPSPKSALCLSLTPAHPVLASPLSTLSLPLQPCTPCLPCAHPSLPCCAVSTFAWCQAAHSPFPRVAEHAAEGKSPGLASQEGR